MYKWGDIPSLSYLTISNIFWKYENMLIDKIISSEEDITKEH